MGKSLQERFDALTSFEPNSGCLLWTGALMGAGYGKIKIGPKFIPATHLALELDGRPRSEAAMQALHKCDNPCCVNAGHLFWGTQTDNMADQQRKGRHWGTRLTHYKCGHPVADNKYTDNRGRKTCRTCHLEKGRTRYQRRKQLTVKG